MHRLYSGHSVGPYRVSTVFLGVNHNFGGGGAPILWETMVFSGGESDVDSNRCAGGREQAEAMHAQMVHKYTAVAAGD
jgi:hypothetical protein